MHLYDFYTDRLPCRYVCMSNLNTASILTFNVWRFFFIGVVNFGIKTKSTKQKQKKKKLEMAIIPQYMQIKPQQSSSPLTTLTQTKITRNYRAFGGY